MHPAKLLEGAIKVLEENNLCKGRYAKDDNGDEVDPLSDNATSFCALGSMYRSASLDPCDKSNDSIDEVMYKISQRIQSLLDGKSIAQYNEEDSTTKEDIINIFKLALSNIKGETCVQ